MQGMGLGGSGGGLWPPGDGQTATVAGLTELVPSQINCFLPFSLLATIMPSS